MLGACTLVVFLGIIWSATKSKAQEKKIRVWVCPGNRGAASVAQGVEAKLNSTLRFDTVRDTYATDFILFVNCLSVQDNSSSLKSGWVCSSVAQVVAGDLIAVPYDEADNLVVGTQDYAATTIFERFVSHTSDSELRESQNNFRKKLLLYCKTGGCAQ